jgi:chromosome segregation ATPase
MTEGKGSRGSPGEGRSPRVDPRAEPDSLPPPAEDVAHVKRPYPIPRERPPESDPYAPRHPTQKLPALIEERERESMKIPTAMRDSLPPVSSEAAAGLASLRHRLPQLQGQLADAHRLLAREQEERAEDADKIAQLVERVTEIESRLTAADMKVAELAHELEDARQIGQELRISEQVKEDANEVLRKQVGEMQLEAEAHARLQSQLVELQKEMAAARTVAEAAQAARKLESSELEKARVALEMTKGERDKHADEVAKLDGNLKQANMKAVAAAKQLETWKTESQRMMDQLRRDHEIAVAAQRADHAAALARAEKQAEERVAAATKVGEERAAVATKVADERAAAAVKELQERVDSVTRSAEQRVAAAKKELATGTATAKALADELVAAANKLAQDATRSGEEQVAALKKLNKESDERFERTNKQLADTVLELTTVRKDRDALRVEVEQSQGRVEQMKKTIEATSEMLSLASVSLEAAEQTEVEIARIREAAKERRRQVLEQALAARKTLQRASPPSPPSSSSSSSASSSSGGAKGSIAPEKPSDLPSVPKTLSFTSVVPPPPTPSRSATPPVPAMPPPLPAFGASSKDAPRPPGKTLEERLELQADDLLDDIPSKE